MSVCRVVCVLNVCPILCVFFSIQDSGSHSDFGRDPDIRGATSGILPRVAKMAQ